MGGDGRDSSNGKGQQAQESVGDKLADFGRDLFRRGKSAVDGAQKEVQGIDFKKLADQTQEKLKNVDVEGLAGKAGKVLQGANSGDVTSIAGAAAGIAFPQLAILNKGSQEAGDFIARKRASSMLNDPKSLSDKLLTSFDELDRKKTGFLTDEQLRTHDGLTGIGSDNRALSLIMRSGFTTLNSLDGNASKKGISREDMQIFSMMQDKDLLSDYARKNANSQGLGWGLAGAGLGTGAAYFSHAGMDVSMAALKSAPLGRLALGAVIGAVAIGGAAKLISQHRQNSFFEEKGLEVERMLKAMKNTF